MPRTALPSWRAGNEYTPEVVKVAAKKEKKTYRLYNTNALEAFILCGNYRKLRDQSRQLDVW